MKFEQALKAMRRGEVVKRKDPGISAIRFWIENDRVMSKGPHDDSPRESTDSQFSMKGCVYSNDWVIVRKKRKARRLSEDELEPVGTVPVVGDKFIALYGRHDQRGVDVVAEVCGGSVHGERERHWSDSCFAREAPDGAIHRILRRPAKPLRDVFADPRVGDVLQVAGCEPETIRYIDADMVATRDTNGRAWAWDRGENGQLDSDSFTVISRAPEEVAPK